MRPLYFKIFSALLLNTFLSPGIATSINMHAPYLSSWIMTECYYYYYYYYRLKTDQANHDPHPQPIHNSNVTTSHLTATKHNAQFVNSQRSPQYLPFFHKSVRTTDAATLSDPHSSHFTTEETTWISITLGTGLTFELA